MRPPRNNKVTFERWRECPRCGFDYPLSWFVIEYQTMIEVCPMCVNELAHGDYMSLLPDYLDGEERGDDQR
jgi:hypothetical protein